jgi:hypothetical protein
VTGKFFIAQSVFIIPNNEISRGRAGPGYNSYPAAQRRKR